MVLYFSEIDNDTTSTNLHQKARKVDRVEYQGILNNIRTDRGNRIALFVVDDPEILKFKILFPNSSMVVPKDVPDEVLEYFKDI